ncbi:MAG: TetR/AcrR family transcriptional regulator [Eggerthellaceae bacterium]|nr:TetR/AcrR family transcriptional regulator [Eggerthellaceae bacterium]
MADRRVARTQAAVVDAFERLLDAKGYSRMTVQEILDAANVGRATFYAHFQGKEGVMEAFVSSVIEHVAAPENAEPGHDFTGRGDMAAQVEHALRHVHEHGHAVRALLMGGGSLEFVGALRDAAFARLRQVARNDYEARFLTGALVETVVCWVETDYAEKPEYLARSYAELATTVCQGEARLPEELC